MDFYVCIIINVILIIFYGICFYKYNQKLQKTFIKITNEMKTKEKKLKDFNKKEVLNYKQKIKNTKWVKDKKITKCVVGKYKLLIGDYMLESASNTFHTLTMMGFEVDVVKTSDDLIHILEQDNDYDFILSNSTYDENSSITFGIQAMEYLKNKNILKSPFIVVSIYNEKEKFLNLGFDSFINKYIDEKKVIEGFATFGIKFISKN